MIWLKKIFHEVNNLDDREKKERLFFHDIINQTHGLILFFNQKQCTNKTISVEEIHSLEKEVRTLQSLIKDHFHFKHKNLQLTYDWVPFDIAEAAVRSLLQTYLPTESVETTFSTSFLEKENSLVYFPIFYRIMNNLIKNMAEVKTDQVHLYFKYSEAGLLIETKNKNNSNHSFEELTDRINQEKPFDNLSPVDEALGLESIYHLSMASGGSFEFEIKDGHWINRIFLTGPEKVNQQNMTKKAA